MIDWTRVEELCSEVGQEDFEEVVSLFLSEVEDAIERLGEQRATGSPEHEFHFLKGSALNLGFNEFGALCDRYYASPQRTAHEIEELGELYRKSKAEFIAQLPQHLAA